MVYGQSVFGSLALLFISCVGFGTTLELKAFFSQHGLHGTMKFTHLRDGYVKLSMDLRPTLEYPNQIWSWSIREFPVDYRLLENRCDDENVGPEVYKFDGKHGYLILPENSTTETVINDNLQLIGPNGIYGKSIVLIATDLSRRICAGIIVEDKSLENVAVAKFTSPLAGHVYFRWLGTAKNEIDALIQTDLYHVTYNTSDSPTTFTEHKWKIYITDILDNSKNKDNCNILQQVFNPQNQEDEPAIGDIDNRLGQLKIATNHAKTRFKTFYRDEQLFLLPSDIRGTKRHLYIVVFDDHRLDNFLACAKIEPYIPLTVKALLSSEGIQGDITLSQNSHFDPTMVNINLSPAKGDLESKLIYGSMVGGYRIHELPIRPSTTVEQYENPCLTTNAIYNPSGIIQDNIPPPGFGTQDQYAIGDLTGKLQNRNNVTDVIPGSSELQGSYWDLYLPLSGKYSAQGRSLVIYQIHDKPEENAKPWICANILPFNSNGKYQRAVFSARALLRYPIVGTILFRQFADDPLADTTVLIEKLVHADGAQLNDTKNHRWAIGELKTGKDYYNWTARCLSAGDVYNPYEVFIDHTNPTQGCSHRSMGLCLVGDLTSKLGTLDIAGRNLHGYSISRKIFTDSNLPLTGPSSILGKSVVIYDDHGPVARGERLACSTIYGVYRRKAVIRDWYGNGEPLSVTGKIEMFQQTEYDVTDVEIDIQGLIKNSGYHVHMTPVQSNLEFPCEGTTLYDHWNPLKVDPLNSPRSYQGTTDEYEMGDLSGKFGTLDSYETYKTFFNDTMLPLFGPRSILGRSVVIHKKAKNRRWACATIERGYSPSEARELRAIASFHHPYGYAYGYIRMTQLVHNVDGSKSDTIIEVNIRHPGVNDRNITRNHDWAIYVNPVGVDASVKVYATRCVAGGYRWNPYYTQLADPLNMDLYRQECGPDNPLRCHVGDISARVGTIDIGLKRQVFTDSNLPLEGAETALGRSIVILSPNRGSNRFACANIEPDYDIIKYANIEKPPRFVLAQFIDDIRHVMGIPEWMLTVDARKTKLLHGGACIQFQMHFKGPVANDLERDFTRLIVNGRLDSPTLYIPGYIDAKRKHTVSYRQCGTSDPNEKRQKKIRKSSSGAGVPTSMNLSLIFVLYQLKIWF